MCKRTRLPSRLFSVGAFYAIFILFYSPSSFYAQRNITGHSGDGVQRKMIHDQLGWTKVGVVALLNAECY